MSNPETTSTTTAAGLNGAVVANQNTEAKELAAKAARAPLAFEPQNFDDAWRMAGVLAQSNLLPEALRGQQHDVLLTMLAGRELGLSAIQSMRLVYVVKGKPYISTQLKMARVKNSPECVYFKCIETTDTRATFETERKGEGVTKVTFTIEDAKRAGLVGRPPQPGKESNWDKYTPVMLRYRAASQLCDLVYSDVTNGVGTTEELEDMRRAEQGERVYAPTFTPTQPATERVIGQSATPAAAKQPAPELKVVPIEEEREPGADEDEAPQTSADAAPAEDQGPTQAELELEQLFAKATKPGELLPYIAKINALPDGLKLKWQRKFMERREELAKAGKSA